MRRAARPALEPRRSTIRFIYIAATRCERRGWHRSSQLHGPLQFCRSDAQKLALLGRSAAGPLCSRQRAGWATTARSHEPRRGRPRRYAQRMVIPVRSELPTVGLRIQFGPERIARRSRARHPDPQVGTGVPAAKARGTSLTYALPPATLPAAIPPSTSKCWATARLNPRAGRRPSTVGCVGGSSRDTTTFEQDIWYSTTCAAISRRRTTCGHEPSRLAR